jgi:hypothetical protein
MVCVCPPAFEFDMVWLWEPDSLVGISEGELEYVPFNVPFNTL